MTYEFQIVLRLLGAACTGTDAPLPPAVQWETVFSLAQQQHVLPLICRALRDAPPPGCPNVLPAVLTQCARTGSIVALLEEMEQAGLSCCILKGVAAAANYAFPEYRSACDTDIVIRPSDERRVCAFLEGRGFTVRPRWENGHHAVAAHPEMGVIEIHVRLYDGIIEDIWSLQEEALLQEPRQRVHTPDGSYWTLGPTDHLIFMSLHLAKHFVLSGLSLQMMTDVALAIVRHRDALDMARFWSTMEAMRFSTLLNTVLWILILYCGFTPEQFPGLGICNRPLTELIVQDLEHGGWLGKQEEDGRKSGWYEYNRTLLMKSKSRLQYRLYMLNWQHSLRFRTVFPGKERLAEHYPCVLAHPTLIPFAWLHRILFRGFALLRDKSWETPIIHHPDEISAEGKARIAMFQRLEMLP